MVISKIFELKLLGIYLNNITYNECNHDIQLHNNDNISYSQDERRQILTTNVFIDQVT